MIKKKELMNDEELTNIVSDFFSNKFKNNKVVNTSYQTQKPLRKLKKQYKTIFNNSEHTIKQNYGKNTRKVVRKRIAAR